MRSLPESRLNFSLFFLLACSLAMRLRKFLVKIASAALCFVPVQEAAVHCVRDPRFHLGTKVPAIHRLSCSFLLHPRWFRTCVFSSSGELLRSNRTTYFSALSIDMKINSLQSVLLRHHEYARLCERHAPSCKRGTSHLQPTDRTIIVFEQL